MMSNYSAALSRGIPNSNVSLRNDTFDIDRPLPVIKPPNKENYRQCQERIAVVNVVGSPRAYTDFNIQQAIVNADVPPQIIEGICQMDYGKKWHIRFDHVKNRDRFVARLRTLEVKIEGRITECPITSYYDDLRVVRVKGLGLALPEECLYDVFAPYGDLKLAIPEKSKGLFTVYNGNYLCSLKIKSEDAFLGLPDEVKVNIEGEEITLSLVAFGLPPKCHRCKTRGHVKANCTTRCAQCGSGDHMTEDHPESDEPTPQEARDAALAAQEKARAVREQQRILREKRNEEMKIAELERRKEMKRAKEEKRKARQLRLAEVEGDSQAILPGQDTPVDSEDDTDDEFFNLGNTSLGPMNSAIDLERKRKISGSEHEPFHAEKKSSSGLDT